MLGTQSSVFGQSRDAGSVFPLAIESTDDPLSYLCRAHFEPFIGSTLTAARAGSTPAELLLLEVSELSMTVNQQNGYAGESFSLLFRSDQVVEADIYTFRHSSLGSFTLFLTPVGRTGYIYEAVINRISR
jgi:hypothetical protein